MPRVRLRGGAGGEREGGRRISVAMRRGKTSRRLHETTHEVGDEGVARRVRTSASAAAAVPPRAATRDAPHAAVRRECRPARSELREKAPRPPPRCHREQQRETPPSGGEARVPTRALRIERGGRGRSERGGRGRSEGGGRGRSETRRWKVGRRGAWARGGRAVQAHVGGTCERSRVSGGTRSRTTSRTPLSRAIRIALSTSPRERSSATSLWMDATRDVSKKSP